MFLRVLWNLNIIYKCIQNINTWIPLLVHYPYHLKYRFMCTRINNMFDTWFSYFTYHKEYSTGNQVWCVAQIHSSTPRCKRPPQSDSRSAISLQYIHTYTIVNGVTGFDKSKQRTVSLWQYTCISLPKET